MNKPEELFIDGGTVLDESRQEFLEWLQANKPSFALAANISDTEQLQCVRRLLIELLDTERLLDMERATVKELSGKLGEFIADGVEIKFQKIAEVTSQSTKGKYALGVVQPGNVPAAVSQKTQRVFILPWEKIARLAIAEGIDERESRLIIPSR